MVIVSFKNSTYNVLIFDRFLKRCRYHLGKADEYNALFSKFSENWATSCHYIHNIR